MDDDSANPPGTDDFACGSTEAGSFNALGTDEFECDLLASSDAESPPTLGLPDRFEARGVIGQGGFGRIFRAFDRQCSREVAIKIVPRLGVNAQALERYRREQEELSKLDHPSIIAVLDVMSSADSVSIVAPIVEGQALSHVLTSQGHIPPPEAARIVAVLAEALHLVHERGLVHGDIYPWNVFLGVDGHVALAGWKTALMSTSTGDGLRPSYASPERLGDLAATVSPRSDIYSLGVLLYELLTGEQPFRGKDTLELIGKVLTATPKPPRRIVRSIPAPLEAICLKAMARNPDDRYDTAGELALALREFLKPVPRRGFWK